jgi:hypothetical protein
MKKRLLAATTSGLLLLAIAVPALGGGVASANGPDGVPGEANCHGKTVSGQAKEHGGMKKTALAHPGATGGTVQGAQDFIQDYCDAE